MKLAWYNLDQFMMVSHVLIIYLSWLQSYVLHKIQFSIRKAVKN